MKLTDLNTLLRNKKEHCKYNHFFVLVFLIVKVVVP